MTTRATEKYFSPDRLTSLRGLVSYCSPLKEVYKFCESARLTLKL
ncbi:hypothetical protein XBO1_1940071 [Xenorhabdus bovienii str. oregonense]|uniref:Uncharacterized protein n=1 Tax=Xenorhabdus bovienii str. oregonense TaxID=1398202 RepID=A0A077P3D5_XENBV|nr:hypothetical protein XBO1_1940071 [Xenorhabdus bovienii str. oregonense]